MCIVLNENLLFSPNWSEQFTSKMKSSFRLVDNFVSDVEEKSLMAELEPHLKRLHYEKNHWDDVSEFL